MSSHICHVHSSTHEPQVMRIRVGGKTNLIRKGSGWEANTADTEHGKGTRVLVGTVIQMVTVALGDNRVDKNQ